MIVAIYIVGAILWTGFALYMDWKTFRRTSNTMIAVNLIFWPILITLFLLAVVTHSVAGSDK